MRFDVLGEISDVETIATGSGIREIARLRRVYGRGRWRKRKGIARVRLPLGRDTLVRSGSVRPQGNQDQAPALRAISMPRPASKQLVVCVKNDGYPVSLEKRKIYVVSRDIAAEKHGLLRIVDESGEDYLYPKTFFRAIALPQSTKRAVLDAA